MLTQGLIDRAEVVERELPHPQRDLSQSVHSPHPLGAAGNGATVSPAGVGEWVLSRMMSRAVSSSAWEDGVAEEVPPLVLYERGEPSDAFTLILQGRVLIRTGMCPCAMVQGSIPITGLVARCQSFCFFPLAPHVRSAFFPMYAFSALPPFLFVVFPYLLYWGGGRGALMEG